MGDDLTKYLEQQDLQTCSIIVTFFLLFYLIRFLLRLFSESYCNNFNEEAQIQIVSKYVS